MDTHMFIIFKGCTSLKKMCTAHYNAIGGNAFSCGAPKDQNIFLVMGQVDRPILEYMGIVETTYEHLAKYGEENKVKH